MLPHNGEESLLPVTFLHWGYPELSCTSHSGMHGSLFCPCSQNYLFISTERTVQLLDCGSCFCASVIVQAENTGSSKPKLLLTCNCPRVCELYLNVRNEQQKKTWLLKGTHGFLKGIN